MSSLFSMCINLLSSNLKDTFDTIHFRVESNHFYSHQIHNMYHQIGILCNQGSPCRTCLGPFFVSRCIPHLIYSGIRSYHMNLDSIYRCSGGLRFLDHHGMVISSMIFCLRKELTRMDSHYTNH